MAAGDCRERTQRAAPHACRRAPATVVAVASGERCDSCGGTAADIAPVHRVYVTPAAWDTEERVEVVDEVEAWCSACRSQYPHQELAGGA